jgi:uncharacterized protein
MEIELNERPQNPTIIQAFPGFGLVGTITTEYLISHLKCRLIGRKWFEELPSAIAIHKGEIIQPIGIYYNDKYNIIIVHSITGVPGMEWKIADFLEKLGNELNAKEFISLDGIGTTSEQENPNIYFYTNKHENKNLNENLQIKNLDEGIIMGVTSALLLKTKRNINAFFVETHSEFPDSKASAELIKILDKLLNLEIDPEPLYESAKLFEDKFNKIIEKGKLTQTQFKKKQLNYVG